MTVPSSAQQQRATAGSNLTSGSRGFAQNHQRPARSRFAAWFQAARAKRAPRCDPCSSRIGRSGHQLETNGRSVDGSRGAASVARSRSASEAAAGNRRCVLKTQLRGVRSASLTAFESVHLEFSLACLCGRRPKEIGVEIGWWTAREPHVHTTYPTVNSPGTIYQTSLHFIGAGPQKLARQLAHLAEHILNSV